MRRTFKRVANLEGQSSLGTGVEQSGWWRSNLDSSAMNEDSIGKRTLEPLDEALWLVCCHVGR